MAYFQTNPLLLLRRFLGRLKKIATEEGGGEENAYLLRFTYHLLLTISRHKKRQLNSPFKLRIVNYDIDMCLTTTILITHITH